MPHTNPFVVPVFLLLRADIAEVRGDLAATNERLARVEGTVAGALGRGFPERTAQAPEAEG